MAVTSAYDPISELFVGNFDRPPDLEDVNLRALTPFQRALLVIDGTVTKFIEAVTMEQVEIELIDQATHHLKSEHRLLEVLSNTPVINRRVLLLGKYSRTLHAYASSVVVPERALPDFNKKLEIPGESLGRMLLESRMEQYRELLWCGRERLTDPPDAIKEYRGKSFLSRTYRISTGKRPVMLINEKFPFETSSTPLHH